MTELSPAARLNLANEPYCECCDVRVSSCGKQKETKQMIAIRAYREELKAIGWFRAQWPGTCSRCTTPFDAMTMIKNEQYGHRKYIGECCAPF